MGNAGNTPQDLTSRTGVRFFICLVRALFGFEHAVGGSEYARCESEYAPGELGHALGGHSYA